MKYQEILFMLKVIRWPILLLFLLVLFYSPINNILKELSNNRGKELQNNINQQLQINKDFYIKKSLERIIPLITPLDFEILLLLNKYSRIYYGNQYPNEYYEQKNANLLKMGIIRELNEIELKESTTNYGIEITFLGNEVLKIIDIIKIFNQNKILTIN